MPSLVFTSCMDAERRPDQPVWEAIRQQGAPDLLLLLGDVIYMDWGLAALARVPAALRAWREAKTQDRRELLAAFAEDMHARYAAQWRVPGFRRLLQDMPTPRRVLLCWDDHDFAWNNGIGRGGQGPADVNDKQVPPALKRASQLLREQFAARLQGATDESYPAAPPALQQIDPGMADADTPPPRQLHQLAGVTVAVLDQRFSRTDRDASPAQLLAAADGAWLAAELQRPAAQAGLLILAGGSPLKHRSLLGGHAGWWAEPDASQPGQDRAYPEYALLRQTQRPVLYLGGEVHRNAWGGWVELPPVGGGPRVPVLQALSSGAALGRLAFHQFPGSHGRVTLQGTALDGQATVALHTLGEPSSSHMLRWQGGALVPAAGLEGECTQPQLATEADERLLQQVTLQPLAVLSQRRLAQDFLPGQAILANPAQLDGQVFLNRRPENLEWPLACWVQGAGAQIQVQRPTQADEPARAAELLAEVFRRHGAQGHGVLLFIHGFGKGFAASLTQAAELQARHGCEVVLLSWPAGTGEGLLATLGSLPAAKQAASALHMGTSAAVAAFNTVAGQHPGVKAVVMARSLGALALSQAAAALVGSTQKLTRMVLSAPACNRHELKPLARLGCELVATVNANDRTLKWAKFAHPGDLVGNDTVDPVEGVTYLDCTAVPGVGDAHDYLLRDLNGPLSALNGRLLRGEAVDWAQPGVAGLVVTRVPA